MTIAGLWRLATCDHGLHCSSYTRKQQRQILLADTDRQSDIRLMASTLLSRHQKG